METETVQINAAEQIEGRTDRFGRRLCNFSMRIPETDYRSLEQASRKNKISMTQVILSALNAWIADQAKNGGQHETHRG